MVVETEGQPEGGITGLIGSLFGRKKGQPPAKDLDQIKQKVQANAPAPGNAVLERKLPAPDPPQSGIVQAFNEHTTPQPGVGQNVPAHLGLGQAFNGHNPLQPGIVPKAVEQGSLQVPKVAEHDSLQPGLVQKVVEQSSPQHGIERISPQQGSAPAQAAPAVSAAAHVASQQNISSSLHLASPQPAKAAPVAAVAPSKTASSPAPVPSASAAQVLHYAAPSRHSHESHHPHHHAHQKKSRLDEIRDSIEESARRKGHPQAGRHPASEKHHVSHAPLDGAANVTLAGCPEKHHVSAPADARAGSHPNSAGKDAGASSAEKNAGAASDRPAEKNAEADSRYSAGMNYGAGGHPASAGLNAVPASRPEPSVDFQKQLAGLMDVSEKRSKFELEQIRSQMDGLRRQISGIPRVMAQKDLDELSPLREEVFVLRKKLRKSIANVSDAGERAKLEDTLSRVEALSRVFEFSPQHESIRSELEEMRSQLNSISAAVERTQLIEEGSVRQGSAEREAIRRELSELHASLEQLSASQQSSAVGETLGKLGGQLKVLEANLDARSISEFARVRDGIEDIRKKMQSLPAAVEEAESRNFEALQRKVDALSRRVGSVLPEDFGALRDELRSMRNSVRSILSSSRSREEAELAGSLQKDLSAIMSRLEERSAVEFGKLERNLADVKSRVSGIPAKIEEGRPGIEAVKAELKSLKSSVDNALAHPNNEEETRLLKGLQSRLEALMASSEARSSSEFVRLEGELADVRDRVSRLPGVVGARERSELGAVRDEFLGLQRIVGEALSRPRDEEETKLLKGLQSRLEGLLSAGEARSMKELGELRGELEDIRRKVVGIPSRVEEGERPELDAVKRRISGLQADVSYALSRPKDEAEKRLLKSLQSRLEELSQASEARNSSEFARLENELSDVRDKVSKLPGVVGARERPEFDAIHGEVLDLQRAVGAALSRPRDEAETKLLKGIQSHLEELSQASEARNVAGFSKLEEELSELRGKIARIPSIMGTRNASEFVRLEGELSDVRDKVSRIPSIMDAREKPEFDAMRGEIFSLQKVVSDALSRPKNEDETRLLRGLQSRLEELMHSSEARNSSDFVRLEGELADMRDKISGIPSVVGAREKPELDGIKGEIISLRRLVSDAMSRPLDEYEKNVLSGLQSRLEGLMQVSESHNVAEFGKLEGELAGIRTRISQMPGLLGAREKAGMDYVQGEILGLKRLVGEALASPRDEVERKFLKGLESRLEDLFDASESRSLKEIGDLRGELADVRSKVAGIPSRVEAGERPELDAVKQKISSLQKEVLAALSQPKGEEEQKLLKGLQSRLESLSKMSEARNSSDFVRLEGELSDVRNRISSLPRVVGAREKPELDMLRSELAGLKELVSYSLSKPKDSADLKLLKGIESRLERMVQASGQDSAGQLGGLRKELDDVRNRIRDIPSRMEAGEKREIGSLRDEVKLLRSSVSSALAKPKNVEEREMLRKVLSQLDGMVSFFDLRAGATLDELKSEMDSVAGQVSDIHEERVDEASIAREVRSLGESLSKGILSSGKKDRELLARISDRLDALSSLVDSRAGSAAEGVRRELDDVRNQLVAMISAEQPQVESIQFAVLSLKELLEKAIDAAGNAKLERKLESLNSMTSKMLNGLETKTDANLGRLQHDVLAMQKELAAMPAGNTELESVRSALKSLREAVRAGKSSPAAKGSLSDIREGIASVRQLLERRTKVAARSKRTKKGSRNKVSTKKRRAIRKHVRSTATPRSSTRISKRGSRHELKKVVSSLQAEMKSRRVGPRGRSELESFISQLEKRHSPKRSKMPAITRRLRETSHGRMVERSAASARARTSMLEAAAARERAGSSRSSVGRHPSEELPGLSRDETPSGGRLSMDEGSPSERLSRKYSSDEESRLLSLRDRLSKDDDSLRAIGSRQALSREEVSRRELGSRDDGRARLPREAGPREDYALSPREARADGDGGALSLRERISLEDVASPRISRFSGEDTASGRFSEERDSGRAEPEDSARAGRREPPSEDSAPRSDYSSSLQDEKMGRIGSDVKRMRQRLKDIRRLYDKEP